MACEWWICEVCETEEDLALAEMYWDVEEGATWVSVAPPGGSYPSDHKLVKKWKVCVSFGMVVWCCVLFDISSAFAFSGRSR